MPSREASLGEHRITRIGLGTNRLADTKENHAFLRAAVEAGLDFIDTAHLYASGESEAAIGAALASYSGRLTVATKGGYRPGSGSPTALREQFEQSCERLRTKRVALYYLHRVDPETPLEESLGVLADLREAGRIEHVGLSEVSVEEIERARAVVPIGAVENEYHLGERKHDSVVDYCEREGILFVPFYPLRTGAAAAGPVAKKHGATPTQALLAWLLARSPVIVPIPGTLSIDHLRENLGALELELDDEDRTALD